MNKETSEIAKLTERISKDPRSKLFVPLAEEYKKAGDIEMSIKVLTEGLKTNPGYITARSLLGKLLAEKGDLPGAQKEFEEVVKAIPDNLMAQRKLADLYAVQGRPADALKHYKIALSLNPNDRETAMLISEAEAGRDIKKFLAQKTTGPQLGQRPAGQAAPVAPQPVTAGKKQVTPAGTSDDEPEEIMEVEPLDPEVPEGIAASSNAPLPAEFGFLTEPVLDSVSENSEPAAQDESFLKEPVFTPGPASSSSTREGQPEAVPPIGDPFGLDELPAPIEEELPGAFDVLTAGSDTEEPAAGEQEKQADDFTTDTLAELYISQGFFEKAVDIYERMLVDNPDSQGLKDKLTAVRAMSAAPPSESTDLPVSAFAVDSSFDPDRDPRANNKEQDPFALGDGETGLDHWGPSESPTIQEEPAPAAKTARQLGQSDAGFEPREYVPPDAVLRDGAKHASGEQTFPPATAGKEPIRTGDAPTRPQDVRKQEKIERLEGWLKNIIKER